MADLRKSVLRDSSEFFMQIGFIRGGEGNKEMSRFGLCVALTIVMGIMTGVAHASSRSASETELAAVTPKDRGDVYLLRGGVGGVFSAGLDQIGDQLGKKGVKANVTRHTQWQRTAETIIENRKKFGRRPVILIGHSLGANAIIRIADLLKKKRISVRYLVTFAATNPDPIPSNVRKATNYYFKTDGWGEVLVPGKGFRGVLKNIDFSNRTGIGHFNIDKQPRLQRQVINNVMRFVSKKQFASN